MLALPLLSLASASPPDPDHLALTEATALAQISACERSTACGADPEALGRAFLTSAVAAAALRGELALQATADGALLAPNLAHEWRELLPDLYAVSPQPWVLRWLAEQSDSAPEIPQLEFIEPPRPEPPAPKMQPGRSPAVLRGVVRQGDLGGPTTTEAQLEVRGSLSEELALFSKGSWRSQVIDLSVPGHGLVPQLFDHIPPFPARQLELQLGVGPRWSGAGEREYLAYGGAVATSSAIAASGYDRLQAAGLLPAPASVGFGLQAGHLVVLPLAPDGALTLRTSMALQLVYHHQLLRPLDPRREAIGGPSPAIAPIRLQSETTTELQARLAPGLGLGLGLDLDHATWRGWSQPASVALSGALIRRW